MKTSSAAPTDPIRILLVDDQPALLWGLELLINGENPRMAVIGKGQDRDSALRLAAQTQPDLILLDLDLGGELSLDFLPELLSLSPARVLIFTGVYEGSLHERALRDGACGVVRKDASAEVLLQAISRAHQNRNVDQLEEKPHSASQSGAPPL